MSPSLDFILCSHLFSKVAGVEISSLFHLPGSQGYCGMHCEGHPSRSKMLAAAHLEPLQMWAGFLRCCAIALRVLSASRTYWLKCNAELELSLPIQVALDLSQ